MFYNLFLSCFVSFSIENSQKSIKIKLQYELICSYSDVCVLRVILTFAILLFLTFLNVHFYVCKNNE